MKYYKRLKVYKASNVSFNPETKTAYSYNWWAFVKVIDGYTVFNNYYYSPSTRGHQGKIRRLLNDLNIAIDFEIECPDGLQSLNWKKSTTDLLESQNAKLQALINKKGSRKKTNVERLVQIITNKEKINLINMLGA